MTYQIAYVSLSVFPLERALLSSILDVSQRNNARDGLSGILMYHDRLFFQVLEGERTQVENCYARIRRDPRHSRISLTWEGEAETRSFTTWAMGYAGPDKIGVHNDPQIESLVDMNSGKGATTSSESLAVLLARGVFRGFSGPSAC